jgi:hypothetical protein
LLADPTACTTSFGATVVVSNWWLPVTVAVAAPLAFPMATVEVAAAYTAVGATTAAVTRPVKIQAPVDMCGPRITASTELARPTCGRGWDAAPMVALIAGNRVGFR